MYIHGDTQTDILNNKFTHSKCAINEESKYLSHTDAYTIANSHFCHIVEKCEFLS